VLAWTTIGGVAFALVDRKAKRTPTAAPVMSVHQLEASITPTAILSLGFIESTMLLGSICGVFALFVAIQFVYLFGGQSNINIQKFNYADYVHRGFTELVIVALLTF